MRRYDGWWKTHLGELQEYLDEGLTFLQISEKMGVDSRSCVASAVRRYIRKVPDPRPRNPGVGSGNYPRTGGTKGISLTYTEEALTEKWADRKKRRALEKEMNNG